MTRVSPPAFSSACSTPRARSIVGGALDDVALGDAAEVDAHAGRLEEDRAPLAIEHDVPVVDCVQSLGDLAVGGALARAEVVEIADAVVSDVERAAARDGELERALDEPEQLRRRSPSAPRPRAR